MKLLETPYLDRFPVCQFLFYFIKESELHFEIKIYYFLAIDIDNAPSAVHRLLFKPLSLWYHVYNPSNNDVYSVQVRISQDVNR